METLLAELIEANTKAVFSPSQIKKVNKILTALSGLHLFATGFFWSRSLGASRVSDFYSNFIPAKVLRRKMITII